MDGMEILAYGAAAFAGWKFASRAKEKPKKVMAATPAINHNQGDNAYVRVMQAQATRLMDAHNMYDDKVKSSISVEMPTPSKEETPTQYAARLEKANADIGLTPYGQLQPGMDKNLSAGTRMLSNMKLVFPGVVPLSVSSDQESSA